MHKLLKYRIARYGFVGMIALLANFLAFNLTLLLGVSAGFATSLAFIVGGQVSFVGHDRFSFRDRYASWHGWHRRWVKFMPGQFGGFSLNTLVAYSLIEFGVTTAYIIYGSASGAIGTYLWNNCISHRGVHTTRSTGTGIEL